MELQAELLKIKPEVETEKVGFGSLVETSNGIYFISIGMGKVMLDDTSFYAISLASPLGQALKGAQTGDTLTFNGDNIQIISVI